MSNLVLPESNEDDDVMEIKYKATEIDEECFFMIYHMHIQPSEAYGMEAERRKWVIARAIHQKQMEQEMMERHRLMGQIGPNLKV